MRLTFSAWKLALSNIAACWSAMPTVKFACAGRRRRRQKEERREREESLCIDIEPTIRREGCGTRGKIRPAGA